MANIGSNQSVIGLFDTPEISAKSKLYPTLQRPMCGNRLESGSFYATATSPKAGTQVLSPLENVQYTLIRKSGSEFFSSMVGATIRLFNLSTVSLSYFGTNGKSYLFTGTTNSDFVAKISEVLSSETLLLDRPIVLSSDTLQTGIAEQDSPYFETNKAYFVTNISNGNYHIVHSPRIDTANMSNASEIASNISITLSNLNFSSYPETYKVMKKSLNSPESYTCIAQGNITPNELLLTEETNVDFLLAGNFYNPPHAQTYWLTSSGLTYSWTPNILIDSITINGMGSANVNESAYAIFKLNTTQVGSRNSSYVPMTYITASAWYTDPQLFQNFNLEPNTYYSCSVNNKSLISYTASIEVVGSGSAFNSNPIKLIKNTNYQFSIDWANIQPSINDYSLVAYFMTTTVQGSPTKLLIGQINSNVATTYSGTYTAQFYATRTMFGTIILVPKNINTIAVANVSMKPYQNNNYAMDSFTVEIPYRPLLQNEKIELSIELLDSDQGYSMPPIKTHLFVDPNGWTT